VADGADFHPFLFEQLDNAILDMKRWAAGFAVVYDQRFLVNDS